MISDRLVAILKSCQSGDRDKHHFPPTEVFNEGWMLRLVLDALKTVDVPGHPLKFADGATWYSEARLSSPFLRKPKTVRSDGKRDTIGEGYTNADGVIGHFAFDQDHKTKLLLKPKARQFIVVEAKMFSNLSSGIANAREYNQAARNVACMASTIKQSGISLGNLESVGFFVVAPSLERRKERNSNTNLELRLQRKSLQEAVNTRIEGYEEKSSQEEAGELRKWEKEHFSPLVSRLENDRRLSVLSWEQIIKDIEAINPAKGEELDQFYRRCLEYA